jgi:hypothetical protein
MLKELLEEMGKSIDDLNKNQHTLLDAWSDAMKMQGKSSMFHEKNIFMNLEVLEENIEVRRLHNTT